MNTELYIENNRLDITEEISALVTFAIDDIKDFSARSTAWSKTIILPGTANNNKLFGNIFEIGQANEYDDTIANVGYNFNAAKSAAILIFQDNLQSFKGVLRLLEIVVDRGRIEYEVSVFGELSSLNVSLSNALLEDLDFSAYDEAWTVANIIASWDNSGGSGLYYPLIDYGSYGVINGNVKHHWDFRTMRPALYVKEFIDKMFEDANFRYESDILESDRFKRLIIPNNRKALYSKNSILLDVSADPQVFDPPIAFEFVEYPNQAVLGSFTTSDNITFTYGGITDYSATITLRVKGSYYSGQNFFFPINFNGAAIDYLILPATPDNTPVDFDETKVVHFNLSTGDQIQIGAIEGFDSSPSFEINLDESRLLINADSTESVGLTLGETIDINYNLPKNIRQIDFLVSLVKLFNLYVYEDQFDQRKLYIKPYINFYSKNIDEVVDWTYKLNRDQPVRIRPMSEINAKIYEFKYKSDSDYYNDLYKKRYGQDYGNHIYDTEFEFAEQKNSFEIIFSPTPLVGWSGEEKVYPTIFKQNNGTEENVDSNIRILQSKKVTGVTSWNIKDGVTVLDSVTDYGYAGHLDDPDAPTNDLNFGALKEAFFTITSGDLSKTQFNVFWSQYMAEITNKDSKLVTAKFYLKPSDIFNLDFSKYIHMDGVLFRLNKIQDYNMSKPDECIVELLKSIFSGINSGGDLAGACAAVITLSPAQLTDSGGDIVVEGFTLSCLDGVITITWDQPGFIPYPPIWGYYNSQKKPIVPSFDDNDAPTVITIDIGTIPDGNTHLIIPCLESGVVLTLTAAQITDTSGPIFSDPFILSAVDGEITLAWTPDLITLFGKHPIVFAYFKRQDELKSQQQPISLVLNDNDNPTSITISLGTIPDGDAHLVFIRALTETVIELSPAEVVSSDIVTNGIAVSCNDGAVTVTMNAALLTKHGEFPYIEVFHTSKKQASTISLDDNDDPAEIIIKLGDTPGDTTRLILR